MDDAAAALPIAPSPQTYVDALRAARTALHAAGVQDAVVVVLGDRGQLDVVAEDVLLGPPTNITLHGQRLRLLEAMERWCGRLRKQMDSMQLAELPQPPP